ncbi:MAG: hypothetical protein H0X51_00845 [Parachlamydiaceae bacterium]|nr:hypothetical protein [Parachlamydiaceae bacterium]
MGHQVMCSRIKAAIANLKPLQKETHEKSFDAAIHSLIEVCEDYLNPARNATNVGDRLYVRVSGKGGKEQYFSHIDGRELLKTELMIDSY